MAEASPEELLIVSRSLPPDTGGYQRQLSLLAPHLATHLGRLTWIGAVRDRPGPGAGSIDHVDRAVRVPAHRLPRSVRGGADLVVAALAVGSLLLRRLRGRPTRVLLLSPGMVGGTLVARIAGWLGMTMIVRYPTQGDMTAVRGRRVGSLERTIAVAPSPSQVDEQGAFAVRLVPNAVVIPPAPVVVEPVGHGGTFLFVGRLVARKRVDVLIDAWSSVADDLPGWRLVIVGDGGSERDSIEVEVRARVEARPNDRIELIGRVADAQPWIEAADVFVFPSGREGLPNSVLEAMASGLPVIADAARAADWFEQEPPLLPWNGSVDDLARALREAATSPALRRSVGAASRAFVERHHAPAVAAAALVGLR